VTDLAVEEATRAEDGAIREAIARSLNDLIPADNAHPMDAAVALSMHDWEREEAQQQRRLLDLAAARCRAAPMSLIKLEDSSEDVWYWPTLSRHATMTLANHWGASGHSSNQQAPPPEDGGGDYTMFYRHFGM
jgi:hypothetical protein